MFFFRGTYSIHGLHCWKFVTASSMQSLVNKAEKPAMLQGRVCENFGLCDCTVDCTGFGLGNAKNANVVGEYACLISWVCGYTRAWQKSTLSLLTSSTSLTLLTFTSLLSFPPLSISFSLLLQIFFWGEGGEKFAPPQIMPFHPWTMAQINYWCCQG